ncbi:organic hydroperoxide resistance protein [Bordetella genomosp. 4]|uniref:organic hydroperoxide resistance protein n=1 Tax=Bordetella genomosp. 4 TaxID=463044 RepID=UPI000B9E759A|nr:organic hydroperoxide resistance protein [Bordetella genomosp. 4]OZI43059.1 peroxiredoxin [Bordetella genomosp. 4]
MTQQLEHILYTAYTHTTGGREGTGSSSDGALAVKLSTPGSNKPGTNPEQLFGVGYSACFIGAMQLAARKLDIRLPENTAVNADVSLGKTSADAYALAVTLHIDLPGLHADQKQQLVQTAHQTCPYSAAIRGNIEVTLLTA